jgi:uncharacterized delta-60 repeat protein
MKSAPFFLTYVFVLLFLNVSVAQFSQPGELDTTFNFGKAHQYFSDAWNPTPGGGANSTVEQIIELSGGKSFIVGDFQTYNGTIVNRTARLNPDGSLDGTFNSGTGANSIVYCAEFLSNGKVIIGGAFTAFNGNNKNRLVRLNTDGSIDNAFNLGTGFNDNVRHLSIQPDGRVVVVGEFTSYNGTPANKIVRLNTNGSVDATFNLGLGANNLIDHISVLPNGKLLIAGEFTSYNGVARNRLALLNSNGSLDTLFNIGSGANGTVEVAELQPDGRILFGGSFTTYNGVARNYIARILSNGSLDTSFVPTSLVGSLVKAIHVQPNGLILVGGMFTNSTLTTGIRRLTSTGSLDNSFQAGPTGFGSIHSIRVNSIGELLIGGEFSSFQGIPRSRVAKLKSNGKLDVAYNLGTGANGEIRAIAIQPDGKMILVGNFTLFNDVPANRIVRIDPNGIVDTSFFASVSSSINKVILQPDQKILIGGFFSNVNGTALNRIARLNPNGSLDTTYISGFQSTTTGGVYTLNLQNDGKIIIGGTFNSYAGLSRNGIARLNFNGSIDLTFDPGLGVGGPTNNQNDVLLLPNGKLLVGGSFANFNGQPRSHLVRLNSNGTVDLSFNAGFGLNNSIYVYKIGLMNDGKIVVSGNLPSTDGISITGLSRLHSDGSLDTTFSTTINTSNQIIGSLHPLQNGGLIATYTEFNTANGVRGVVMKFSSDGTQDPAFNLDSGSNSEIKNSQFQSDGKLVIVGDFIKYNRVHRNRIARVHVGNLAVGLDHDLLERDMIEATPNPFNHSFQIKSSKPFRYQIFSIEGRAFENGYSPNPELSLSTSAWPSGTYILRIITVEGVAVRKLVKE